MTAVAPHNEDHLQTRVLPEDRARAEVYALLGNLFFQPPAEEFLRAIATNNAMCNDAEDSEYCRVWRALQNAAAAVDGETVKAEFDAAFISPGRQPVMLYGSFYLAGFLNEKPLVELRDELTQMGLARSSGGHETEDHISALCDVMRFLILGDHDTPPAELERQRDFFRRHIGSWVTSMCDAVYNAREIVFYKHVAQFAREFFSIENQSFDIA